jgi:Uma2 family endonuclease
MQPAINLEAIKQSVLFGKIVAELQEAWQQEQAKRHAFWKAVDETQKAEFINGEGLYDSPVYGRHWMVSSNILTLLLPFVKENKLGKVGIEKVMIRCTRNDYEPDICFWEKEKSDTFTPKQSAFPPPDFIIEITSDSTVDRDRGIKFDDYALHGVQEYWIIDPEKESVEQYILNNGQYLLAIKIKKGVIVSEVITGFSIEMEDIFSND